MLKGKWGSEFRYHYRGIYVDYMGSTPQLSLRNRKVMVFLGEKVCQDVPFSTGSMQRKLGTELQGIAREPPASKLVLFTF